MSPEVSNSLRAILKLAMSDFVCSSSLTLGLYLKQLYVIIKLSIIVHKIFPVDYGSTYQILVLN